MDIVESTARHEPFLREELGQDLVEDSLRQKRESMGKKQPFPFLRATYWRWAERIPALLPVLMEAPSVLAVGDVHLENFGTWRDAEGRLVWA